jgi:hypothetical protein
VTELDSGHLEAAQFPETLEHVQSKIADRHWSTTCRELCRVFDIKYEDSPSSNAEVKVAFTAWTFCHCVKYNKNKNVNTVCIECVYVRCGFILGTLTLDNNT